MILLSPFIPSVKMYFLILNTMNVKQHGINEKLKLNRLFSKTKTKQFKIQSEITKHSILYI